MQRIAAIVRPLAPSLCVILLAAWPSGAAAQCGGRWLTSPEQVPPGLNGNPYALAVLPNGELVAAGQFNNAGGVRVNNIARWNGSTWAPLGSGMNEIVWALAALPNGDLVAGGFFTNAGGVPVNKIARWNGTSWSPLGSGMGGDLRRLFSLVVLPNGDLLAGGDFTTAGGVPATYIARWDGASRAPLGMCVECGFWELTVLPNGDLIVGGFFTTISGVAANSIARWDGSTWAPLGAGLSGTVSAFAVLPNGDLVAGGRFTHVGSVAVNRIARWDGATWAPLGTGMGGDGFIPSVRALAVLPSGDLVAGGEFTTAGGVPASNIARWNGSSWAGLGTGVEGSGVETSAHALAVLPSGELVVGGDFTIAGGVPSGYWARWTDTGIPWVAQQPVAQTTSVLGAAAFTVTPASGYDFSGPLTFQWHRNGVALADGVTPNGTVISGATTNALSLSNLSPLDSGSITAAVSNACGSAASSAARLTVGQSACPGDANGDGSINADDLMILLDKFTAAVPPGTLGDVNGDGTVNFLDLAVVLAAFGSAC